MYFSGTIVLHDQMLFMTCSNTMASWRLVPIVWGRKPQLNANMFLICRQKNVKFRCVSIFHVEVCYGLSLFYFHLNFTYKLLKLIRLQLIFKILLKIFFAWLLVLLIFILQSLGYSTTFTLKSLQVNVFHTQD